MLPSWLRLLRFDDREVLFDERTGRNVVWRAETGIDDPRLLPMGMLGALNAAELRVYRLRHPVFLPERGAFLVPDVRVHPAGGYPWRVFHVEHLALAVWEAADGRRTVEQIATRLAKPVPEVFGAIYTLSGFDAQIVQLRPDRISAEHPALCRVVGPPRAQHGRTGEMFSDHGTELGAFHEGISDEATRFDHAETTLAHALAVPHPALGVAYGARLARVLATKKVQNVVEVGGGTGELGAAFVDETKRLGSSVEFLRIDRSPALLAAQSLVNPGTAGVAGDALALPLPDASVDLLIANEIIADLPSVLGDAGWTNTGARAFVRECARVLRRGGTAWVSEFGSIEDEPEETTQLDHPEVSIRFGDLVQEAERAGLVADLRPIAEVLGMDLDARWLWRPHLGAVRAVDALNGRAPTKARAWTEDSLHLAEPMQGVRWVSLRDEGPGPLPARMFVLMVRKPA